MSPIASEWWRLRRAGWRPIARHIPYPDDQTKQVSMIGRIITDNGITSVYMCAVEAGTMRFSRTDIDSSPPGPGRGDLVPLRPFHVAHGETLADVLRLI